MGSTDGANGGGGGGSSSSSNAAGAEAATPLPPARPQQYPPTHRGVLYRSTRGGRRDVTFEEVVMGGLAPDRGLYVPQEVPFIAPEQLDKVRVD